MAKIKRGALRDALEEIFEAVRFSNAYYEINQPWKTRSYDIDECRNIIDQCAYLIANIAILFHPFLPFSSAKAAKRLGITLQ